MKVEAFPDILDSDWFALNLDDIFRVHGQVRQADVGFGHRRWTAGPHSGCRTRPTSWTRSSTRIQIGVQRRNTLRGATALTA
jgi:hypothetical protein